MCLSGLRRAPIFEDRVRGVRTVSAEIAHIRSGSQQGPRHVPGFDAVNEPENLLLLCPLHHKPVDEKASVYTIEELEEWKEQQIACGVGAELEQQEIEVLATKLDALIDLLTRATTLELSCSLVSGGESGFGGVLVVPFDARGEIQVGDEPFAVAAIGVEVANSGTLACQIVKAGLEFDVGAPEYVAWSA